MPTSKARKTIADFGAQWTRFTDNSGYYGSKELFEDILNPFLNLKDISGKEVAEIGSGTGRIVSMLLDAGARHVTAIEPSRAFEVLATRFANRPQEVTCVHGPGEVIADLGPFDLVFAIGVLHHIPEPGPVVDAVLTSLKPGGLFFVWLYGLEGNRPYLWIVRPLRALTTRMPDHLLDTLVRLIDMALVTYMWLCRWLPLPMRVYMRGVIAKLPRDKRRLVIFDQLNPSYAKYYTRQEALDLLCGAGYCDVQAHHRHGYSWTVIGRKPDDRDDSK